MKFAHFADCHLGSWRENKLQELSLNTFRKAIDYCLKEYVGFVLISGDLFDTALPSIELIKEVAHELNRFKEQDIPVYIIAGSHDFSTSGKTMLDVLEKAGLVDNVVKLKDNKLELTEDRTGTLITGLYGKRGSLEIEDYKTLNIKDLEEKAKNKNDFKIFMFHTALTEFKGEEFERVESASYAVLPKYFDYYAGGHVHYIYESDKSSEGYGKIVFPGPLFPNNFAELEKLRFGGFYIVEVKDKNISMNHIPLELVKLESYNINVDNKNPDEVTKELAKIKDTKDKLILIRIEGSLKSGKPSDIKFNDIFNNFEEPFFVLKNTNKLTAKEFEEIEVKQGTVEEIESHIIENSDKHELFNKEFISKIMDVLNIEKNEDEKIPDFESRLLKDVKRMLGV